MTTTMTAPTNLVDLIDAWEAHEQLRASKAPIAELSRSRQFLDEVRLEVRRAIAA